MFSVAYNILILSNFYIYISPYISKDCIINTPGVWPIGKVCLSLDLYVVSSSLCLGMTAHRDSESTLNSRLKHLVN